MKTTIVLAAALCAFFLVAREEVQAAPIAATAGNSSDVVLVAQGCGRGFHRGRFGRCVRNMSPAYPCFWRRGPYGRWHLVCR